MIIKVRNSHQEYSKSLKEQKEHNMFKEKEKLEKKRRFDEINELKIKKFKIMSDRI